MKKLLLVLTLSIFSLSMLNCSSGAESDPAVTTDPEAATPIYMEACHIIGSQDNAGKAEATYIGFSVTNRDTCPSWLGTGDSVTAEVDTQNVNINTIGDYAYVGDSFNEMFENGIPQLDFDHEPSQFKIDFFFKNLSFNDRTLDLKCSKNFDLPSDELYSTPDDVIQFYNSTSFQCYNAVDTTDKFVLTVFGDNSLSPTHVTKMNKVMDIVSGHFMLDDGTTTSFLDYSI